MTYPLVSHVKMIDVKADINQENVDLEPRQISMTIIIANACTSIRSFIENGYKDCGAMSLGRVYVQTDQVLSDDQIRAVEDKLKDFPTHMSLDGMVQKNKKFKYTTIETMPNLRATLEKYAQIHIHYSYCSDPQFICINLSSESGCIDINEDTIEYTTVRDRHEYSAYHGHLNGDGTVDIFHYLPSAFEYKCIKVPDGYIVNDHVCQIFRGNFIFYLITKEFLVAPFKISAIIHNTNIDELSESDIRKVLAIFSEFRMGNVTIDQDCMYANDDRTLMVLGVISDKVLGSFGKYVSDLN